MDGSRILPSAESLRVCETVACGVAVLCEQVSLAGSDFDTLLAVFTGAAVDALTLAAYNDNCVSDVLTSCVTLKVAAGTSYAIKVTGGYGVSGAVSIAVSFVWAAPPNDAFSAAGTTFPATGTTLGATLQAGEWAAMLKKGASGSVWFNFTAQANGVAKVAYYAKVTPGSTSVAPRRVSLLGAHLVFLRSRARLLHSSCNSAHFLDPPPPHPTPPHVVPAG